MRILFSSAPGVGHLLRLLPVAREAQCHAAGVARVVALEDADATAVQIAIDAVLRDPSYRRRAREIAAEIAAMPGPDAAMDRIESVVASAAAPGTRAGRSGAERVTR